MFSTLKPRKNIENNIISYEECHPFGTSAYRLGSSVAEVSLKRYRYNGKERDEETGLYYYGARYYAAWLARFVSVDPLADESPDMNPFHYVRNNPVNLVDPDGRQEEEYNKRVLNSDEYIQFEYETDSDLTKWQQFHSQGKHISEQNIHISGENNTLYSLSIRYGIRFEKLKGLNPHLEDNISSDSIVYLDIPTVNFPQVEFDIFNEVDFPIDLGTENFIELVKYAFRKAYVHHIEEITGQTNEMLFTEDLFNFENVSLNFTRHDYGYWTAETQNIEILITRLKNERVMDFDEYFPYNPSHLRNTSSEGIWTSPSKDTQIFKTDYPFQIRMRGYDNKHTNIAVLKFKDYETYKGFKKFITK